MTNVTRTATEYRTMAQESRTRSADSFASCDTDGWASQAASDLMARQYDLMAEVADNGASWEFDAVFTVDGQLTDFRRVQTRYGSSWVRDTAHGAEWFNPSSARKGSTRRNADTRKGYLIGTVRQSAYVTMGGGGKGMAGMASCFPVVLPERDAERAIVATVSDEYGTDWD